MTQPARPTALERVAGNPGTELALTLAATTAASLSTTAALLTPLVPILAKSLAAGRHEKRVDAALQEMSALLESHAQAIRDLSDAQYKLVNETVLALLSCTQVEKLSYLKRVAQNAVLAPELTNQEAIDLSRVVRDISAEEVKTLLDSFKYERIRVGHQEAAVEGDTKTLRLTVNTREAFSVAGLLSLGVLSPGEDSWGGTGSLIFTGIAAKLIALLGDA